MTLGAPTQAQYLTRDWIGQRVTVTLANGDNITGELTGLNIETETVATFGGTTANAITAVEARFKYFGQVDLPPLAVVRETEQQR